MFKHFRDLLSFIFSSNVQKFSIYKKKKKYDSIRKKMKQITKYKQIIESNQSIFARRRLVQYRSSSTTRTN